MAATGSAWLAFIFFSFSGRHLVDGPGSSVPYFSVYIFDSFWAKRLVSYLAVPHSPSLTKHTACMSRSCESAKLCLWRPLPHFLHILKEVATMKTDSSCLIENSPPPVNEASHGAYLEYTKGAFCQPFFGYLGSRSNLDVRWERGRMRTGRWARDSAELS